MLRKIGSFCLSNFLVSTLVEHTKNHKYCWLLSYFSGLSLTLHIYPTNVVIIYCTNIPSNGRTIHHLIDMEIKFYSHHTQSSSGTFIRHLHFHLSPIFTPSLLCIIVSNVMCCKQNNALDQSSLKKKKYSTALPNTSPSLKR